MWPVADHRETGTGARKHVELCFISSIMLVVDSHLSALRSWRRDGQ